MVIRSRKAIRGTILAALAALVLALPIGGSETLPSGIAVEIDSQKPLSLHVTVWSRAEKRVTFAKYRLPWGNRNSMLFVPVNSDGQCISDRLLPIDDPTFEKVSLDPNDSISGDMDLRRFVPELEKALKKSDIHLFWAYKAPEELHIAPWTGGWILIPQRK
jgi:hypothetical protein